MRDPLPTNGRSTPRGKARPEPSKEVKFMDNRRKASPKKNSSDSPRSKTSRNLQPTPKRRAAKSNEKNEPKEPGKFLCEWTEKTSGKILKIWSSLGQELCGLKQGEDSIMEVDGNTGIFNWSAGENQGYVEIPAATTWIWVVRAREGFHTTTCRCYDGRPKIPKRLTCPKNHPVDIEWGVLGILSMVTTRTCDACASVIEHAKPRWNCPKCNCDFCLDCMEKQINEQRRAKPAEVPEDQLNIHAFGLDASEEPAQPPKMKLRSTTLMTPQVPKSKRKARALSMRKKESIDIEPGEDNGYKMPIKDRSLGQLQIDATNMLWRMVAHGDIEGARKVLSRAGHLGLGDPELTNVKQAVQELEDNYIDLLCPVEMNLI